ncbi:MAG TPA: U32 family peptidase [Sedimentisphaerales bacterium]|jgi:putative protease|nr:U32 family peptidase [Sedimentisphaerales bacterium]HNU30214.1 U32 family peptidase [Sedimentisphaerales bacterium]
MSNCIELLAPAKDGPTAQAAILCGADAVYLGAPRFGAREAAGNAVSVIQEVAAFAHQYYAKVYVALNTLLHDDELPAAERLVRQLYDAGIDGLIVQDAGLLELDLPPVPLIASTQMHNATVEKVQFLEQVGFSRVILARELTLEQIREIRRQTQIELECFIHGALCVGVSGQCYMSYALGGRSGNRGQCAQPCRRLYTLRDQAGNEIVKDRHLLSLRDLCLADHLEELIDAGVSSFKIEGRLKDIPYVENTVAFYRRRLDEISVSRELRRSSSGSVHLAFEPNLGKTFNRGFTDYGLTGKTGSVALIDTPKSIGEPVGTVAHVDKSSFVLDRDHDLHNADGLCFFGAERNLDGTVVNRVEGRRVYPQKMQGIRVGLEIRRNFDHAFSRALGGQPAERKIALTMSLRESADGLLLSATDEDGNRAEMTIAEAQPAEKKEAARQTFQTQLTRLGNTIFDCSDLQLQTQGAWFLPVSRLNAAKRELVERLLRVREANRPRPTGGVKRNDFRYPQADLTYLGNVLNAKARAFYRRHRVETIEPAAESGIDMSGKVVMTTKYCLRKELGQCPGRRSGTVAEPMILQDQDGRRYPVRFRCGDCGMDIFLDGDKETR